MTIKKILFITIMFALANCGYQPLYLSKDNSKFSINKITEKGVRSINKKILLRTNLKSNNNSTIKYNLIIESSKNNEVLSKDTNGNPLSYRISIQVDLVLINSGNPTLIFKQKTFNSSFTYNNTGSKFSLAQYVKITEANLIEEISKNIIIFLSI
jgi:hypothetical protein